MILQSRGPPLERGKLFNGLASVGSNEIAMAPFKMMAKHSIVNYPKWQSSGSSEVAGDGMQTRYSWLLQLFQLLCREGQCRPDALLQASFPPAKVIKIALRFVQTAVRSTYAQHPSLL